MTEPNTAKIFDTANQFEVKLPAAVAEAAALLDQAHALRSTIASEVAPSISDVTRKTLTATHQLLVDFENRDARLRAADTLVAHATANLDNAKFISKEELRKPLRDIFTAKAEEFMTARNTLGGADVHLGIANPDAWRTLLATATDLDALATARAAFSPIGSRAKCGLGDNFERISLCLRVPNRTAFSSHRPRGSGHEFWNAALEAGYVIVWQDNAEQERNCEHIMQIKAA